MQTSNQVGRKSSERKATSQDQNHSPQRPAKERRPQYEIAWSLENSAVETAHFDKFLRAIDRRIVDQVLGDASTENLDSLDEEWCGALNDYVDAKAHATTMIKRDGEIVFARRTSLKGGGDERHTK
ncbi:MAG: hypothetical protein HY043_22755 [Verrucomicrobia bacterium]|nr:hypothetical protein [Verrucomicrobiota bacterium]